MLVVDVDDTLSHTNYFHLILRTGRKDARPLRGASEVLSMLANDYEIIYLTSRPTYLLADTRAWLLRKGFPDAPVYTADEIGELVSQQRYKTRYLADLRQRYPNAFIGIGDRASDAMAYRASNMVSIIVNPDEDSHFNSRDVVVRDWTDVKAFFQANRDLLTNPRTLAKVLQKEDYVFTLPPGIRLVRYDDTDDDHGRGELNEALLDLFPKLRRHARAQATAADVLASNRDLRQTMAVTLNRWPGARLVSVRLNRSDGQLVVEMELAHENQLVFAVFSEQTGQFVRSEKRAIPVRATRAIEMGEGRQITPSQAIDIASDRVDGKAYQMELRVEYNRPVYEVSLLSRKGFYEIDVDLATGEIQEVDHEWRLVPLN